MTSPLRGALEDVGGVVFAIVAISTVTGFILWLGTPMLLLRRERLAPMAPGAAVSGLLGALLGVASRIYVPVAMEWSADRYGLIGIAFALQSWLLAAAFVVGDRGRRRRNSRRADRRRQPQGPVTHAADDDVTRRTRSAAERTWLAWWRSGIAAATAAVGVGGVVPSLVDGERTPYVVLGAGYALLAAVIFVAAAVRQRQVERALDAGACTLSRARRVRADRGRRRARPGHPRGHRRAALSRLQP